MGQGRFAMFPPHCQRKCGIIVRRAALHSLPHSLPQRPRDDYRVDEPLKRSFYISQTLHVTVQSTHSNL
jgi:hypothetical protein